MKKIIGYVFCFFAGIFLLMANTSPPNEVVASNGCVVSENDALFVVNTHLLTPMATESYEDFCAIRGPSYTQFVNFELSNSTLCAVSVDQKMMTTEMTRYDFSESTYTYNWNTPAQELTPLSNACPHDVVMPLKLSMTTQTSGQKGFGEKCTMHERIQTTYNTT